MPDQAPQQEFHSTGSVAGMGRGHQLQAPWSSKGSDKACWERPVTLGSTQCVLNVLTLEPCDHGMPHKDLPNEFFTILN